VNFKLDLGLKKICVYAVYSMSQIYHDVVYA
jgi:hypothetical protein